MKTPRILPRFAVVATAGLMTLGLGWLATAASTNAQPSAWEPQAKDLDAAITTGDFAGYAAGGVGCYC